MARRRLMSEGASGVYDVGNIVCYTGVPGVFISVEPSKISTIPNTYSPIGIVVVPTSHDVYGDGSAGVMSLTWMSLKYPRTGYASTNTTTTMYYLYMGCNGELGYNLPLRNSLYIDGVKTTFTTSQSHNWNPFSDTNTPKPYLADGITKNKAYFTQGDDVWGLDFGDSNHNLLITKSEELLASKNYTTNWRNLTDFVVDGLCNYDVQMACLCAEVYRTNGTSAGDWYAPSSGELVYAMCKWDELYNSMQLLKQAKGSSFIWANPFTVTNANADAATWMGLATTVSWVYRKSNNSLYYPALASTLGGYLVATPTASVSLGGMYNGGSPRFNPNISPGTYSMAFTKMKLQ